MLLCGLLIGALAIVALAIGAVLGLESGLKEAERIYKAAFACFGHAKEISV